MLRYLTTIYHAPGNRFSNLNAISPCSADALKL